MIVQARAFTHEGLAVTLLTNNRWTRCAVVDGTAYIFKPSSSSYGLQTPDGVYHQFVCQDGCCDCGLQPDVAKIAEAAKMLGAERIILRTGQGQYYCPEIAGLPVEDVSDHVGEIAKGLAVIRR